MSTNKQALREAELEELNDLLRGKVKQLEEKLWDEEQLRKVHSEKSFELEGKVRELEARNQKDFVWRGQEIGRLNDEVDELKEKLQAAESRIAELEALDKPKFVQCWSCKHDIEVLAIADCDGYCPQCDSPIDLDDESYAATDKGE